MKDNSVNDSNSTVIRFCKVCQCETERHDDGRCKPCKRAYLYRWRKENPAKLNAIRDKWNERNPEKIKEAGRVLYLEKRDEKIAYAKKYYEENKEKLAIAKAIWAKNNKDSVNASFHNRRAKKIASGGRLSNGLKSKLFLLQRGKCACCGLPLGDNFHMDHIMPLALGGPNTDDNMQLLRQRCNNQKHSKHPVDFMQSRGFLL